MKLLRNPAFVLTRGYSTPKRLELLPTKPCSFTQKQPSLRCFPHHPLDLNPVIPLFGSLLAPILIAPVLGVCG